jgi:N-acylneuraminate cytidylyltransferase
LKNLAIILARKNSKRLKGKNNLSLGGKSLIKRAIECAIKSNIYDEIVVSSDDQKILKLSKKFPKINFLKRKKLLAQDKTKAITVVLDIIKNYKSFFSVSLLLPTCPFREAIDVQNAYKIFKTNYKNTVSATNYEFPPEFALKKKRIFFFSNKKLSIT